MLVPAGSSAQVRSSGCKDVLHIYLEPGLVTRVSHHFKRLLGVTPGQFRTHARTA
jgi:hypothetical protein